MHTFSSIHLKFLNINLSKCKRNQFSVAISNSIQSYKFWDNFAIIWLMCAYRASKNYHIVRNLKQKPKSSAYFSWNPYKKS